MSTLESTLKRAYALIERLADELDNKKFAEEISATLDAIDDEMAIADELTTRENIDEFNERTKNA